MATSESSDLKQRIAAATTAAMKARDKARVSTLRLIHADIQRVEVDERRTLSDDDIIAVLNRMLKQRQDALQQYESAGRDDLAAQERYEIDVVREFLPEPLSGEQLDALIDAAIASTGATSGRDMGKVMAELKPKVHGRADMGQLSGKVKARLQ